MGKRSSRRLSSDDDSDDDDRRLWNGETEKNDYRALEGARDLWYGYNDYYDYAEKDEKEIPMPKSAEGARLLDDYDEGDDDDEGDDYDEGDDDRRLWDDDYYYDKDGNWRVLEGDRKLYWHHHGYGWAETKEEEKPQATLAEGNA